MRSTLISFSIVLLLSLQPTVHADILVTEFFPTLAGTGRILRIDEENFAQSVFAEIPGNPGLSGIAYDAVSNKVYVSALNFGGIFVFDAGGVGMPAFHLLGIGPAGLAVDSVGNVYVTDFTSNLVRVYDPDDFTSPLNSFAVPSGVTTGVGVLSNGDVIIATAGFGVYRYDGINVTPFTANPLAQLATSQVAVDSSDNLVIGHGIGFADQAIKFDSAGSVTGIFEVTDAMVGGTGQGSSLGTSPSGVAFDRDGNVIVAALGRSNPGDPGGERGGLFKFDNSGSSFIELASATKSFSSTTVVPNPTVSKTYAFYPGWTGSGSSIDNGKVVHLETAASQELGLDHLINSSGGIRGIGFDVRDFADLNSLSVADFDFRMSPQGAFAPGSNPPSGWVAAPSPATIQVVPGSPDQVLLTWSSNVILNRWLRITLKATASTGLSADRTYYVGHLLGETDEGAKGVFTVTFQDISAIRAEVGNTTTAANLFDINKSGVVSFQDISDMRSAVGSQLSIISVP